MSSLCVYAGVCGYVSVCRNVHSFRVHRVCLCGYLPVCHAALSWYADILVRLAVLTLGLTRVMPARSFLNETIMLNNTFKFSFIDS